jgi:predicted RNase H-like HicB family nuclease
MELIYLNAFCVLTQRGDTLSVILENIDGLIKCLLKVRRDLIEDWDRESS